MPKSNSELVSELDSHIMDATSHLDNDDYVEVLEELSCNLDACVSAKREEMKDD